MNLAEQKARLRFELKEKFKFIKTQSAFVAQRESLLQHLEKWLSSQMGVWASYQALDLEIDVQPLSERLRHLDFVYPKVVGGRLQFLRPGVRGFSRGAFGILEPETDGAIEVPISEISGFLVPGLGFDRKGVRLGKGKGFYDKVLDGVTAVKVGVTLQELLQESLPEENRNELGRDIRMDFIATDRGVKAAVK